MTNSLSKRWREAAKRYDDSRHKPVDLIGIVMEAMTEGYGYGQDSQYLPPVGWALEKASRDIISRHLGESPIDDLTREGQERGDYDDPQQRAAYHLEQAAKALREGV